jgi:hypothetical protein
MSWRDLKPLDDRYELERPEVSEAGSPGETLSEVTLTFSDPLVAGVVRGVAAIQARMGCVHGLGG